MRKLFLILLLSLTYFNVGKMSFACEVCTVPNIGRHQGLDAQSSDKKWFFKYLFERQDWKEIPATQAHQLHHQGHDAHDKLSEDFHHFNLGRNLSDQFSVSVNVPYVIRRSLEIDDHARLGEEEKSHGIGDLTLIGDYRFIKEENDEFGIIGGVKFPTGSTDELNSVGDPFEIELQPGSGAYDYIAGGIYQCHFDQFKLLGNVAYVFKTEGDQDYQFGDLLSSSIFLDYVINPESEFLKTSVGVNGNFQYEQKHRDNGEKVDDSGGTALLLGPSASVEITPSAILFGSILFPATQNPGGVHQEIEKMWTAGAKIVF